MNEITKEDVIDIKEIVASHVLNAILSYYQGYDGKAEQEMELAVAWAKAIN